MCKRIAIIGLGLIGGSMAMALKGFEDYEIVGVDRDPATLEFARTHGVADYLSTDAGQAVSTADVVYLCLHPRGIVDFLSTYRACFRPGALVTDVCGIKTAIVDAATVLPDEVDFIGSHPMAVEVKKRRRKTGPRRCGLDTHQNFEPQTYCDPPEGRRKTAIIHTSRTARSCLQIFERDREAHSRFI